MCVSTPFITFAALVEAKIQTAFIIAHIFLRELLIPTSIILLTAINFDCALMVLE